MGAKQKGGGSKPKNQADEVEETLQAVVLADTFETRFEPFTRDRPRVCVMRRSSLKRIYTMNTELIGSCYENSVYYLSPIPLSSNTPSSSSRTQASKRSFYMQALTQIN
jgi:hypothetical protein